MDSNYSYFKHKKEFRLFISQLFPQLVDLRKAENRSAFNEHVLKIIPEIRKYVNSRLATSIKKGHFAMGKYKADDFIDQLFIEIYEHIADFKTEDQFYVWIFVRVNELLDIAIQEEEFDDSFLKNIDDYSKPEWDEMQEEFSTDGDGDLLMIEELDDMSYNHNDYSLEKVFVEEKEKALIDKLDKHLSQEKVHHHMMLVLHNLPDAMRNVFELFTFQHLALDEIAHIRKSNLEDIESLLNEAKKALNISLYNRFPID